MIRAIWRISAVSNRFLIISLIWTVLGGAFEVILLPSMIILWYLLIGCYTSCQYDKYRKLMYKEHAQDINDRDMYNGGRTYAWCQGWIKARLEPDPLTWSSSVPTMCASILLFFFWLVASVIVGMVLQLGIVGLAGGEFFLVRILENIVLLSIITLFAFNDKIVCNLCADEDLRQATYNPRILGWIIVAWISILIHIITSIYMTKLINENDAVTIKELATLEADKKSIEKKLEQEKEEKLKQENPEFRNFKF